MRELGDALIKDIGPPSDHGVHNGSYAKIAAVADALAEEGYPDICKY
jgi:hypothetical protein